MQHHSAMTTERLVLPLPVNLRVLSSSLDTDSEHAVLGDPLETRPGQGVWGEPQSHVQGTVLGGVHTAPHAQMHTCTDKA